MDTTRKTIYVIRHGETEWNRRNLCMGQQDIALNEKGQNQAQALAAWFRERPLDRVVASDLQRTRQTAAPLCEGKGLEATLDPRLREINYGILEGSDPEKWTEHFPELMAQWDYSSFDQAPPGGESRRQLLTRCVDVLRELLESEDEHIAIVTHGGVVMALMTQVVLEDAGLPVDRSLGLFKVDNGSITTLVRSSGRWRVLGTNHVPN